GFLQLEELEGDIARIEQQYHSLGFLRATVTEFLVLSNVDSKQLEIRLRIDEGPRSRVSAVNIPSQPKRRGKTPEKTPGKSFTSLVKVKKGAPISLLEARADGARLSQSLASLGYPMASVKTICQSPGQEPRPCEQPRRPASCEFT
ncbi:unnamed protein product, partial [Laminaria digitata]